MSKETMKKDFERLTRERLHTVVEDIISLHEIAEFSQREAATCIISSLLNTVAKVIAWAEWSPSRDNLVTMVDSTLRSAEKRVFNKKEAQ